MFICRVMPQPWMARSLTTMPGCGGRYAPIVQATESPRMSMRGGPSATRFRFVAVGALLGRAGCGGGAAAGIGGAGGGTVAHRTVIAHAATPASVTTGDSGRGSRRCRRIGSSTSQYDTRATPSVAAQRTASSFQPAKPSRSPDRN
jgi:hypothetical protein